MQKQCTKCSEIKLISQFSKSKGNKGGHSTHCKSCISRYKKSRKILDNKLREEYYSKPKNRKRKQELERLRRIQKPIDYMYQQVKGRAKRLEIEFNITKEDIIIPKICPILECEFIIGDKNDYRYTYSLDRVDPSKGYIKGNIRVISMLANTMKNSASKEQLLKFSKNIVEYIK